MKQEAIAVLGQLWFNNLLHNNSILMYRDLTFIPRYFVERFLTEILYNPTHLLDVSQSLELWGIYDFHQQRV